MSHGQAKDLPPGRLNVLKIDFIHVRILGQFGGLSTVIIHMT